MSTGAFELNQYTIFMTQRASYLTLGLVLSYENSLFSGVPHADCSSHLLRGRRMLSLPSFSGPVFSGVVAMDDYI